jgi:excisionase family DNA binding protein
VEVTLELLRVAEAAEVLKLESATVYRFIRRGILPAVRIGRTVRIDRDELMRLIKGLPRQSAIEIGGGNSTELSRGK